MQNFASSRCRVHLRAGNFRGLCRRVERADRGCVCSSQGSGPLRFRTCRFAARILSILAAVVLSSVPFVHGSDVFELNPILDTASVSRAPCSSVPQSVNVRCMNEDIPSLRHYNVSIFAYVDFSSARSPARAVNFTCSMHLCRCDKRSPCHCDISDAAEYPCRVKHTQSASTIDSFSSLKYFGGFVHPSDAPFPITPATKFVFKVYVASDDDDAVTHERTLPPLGPWVEFNGVWVLDPSDDWSELPETADDSGGIAGEGSGLYSSVACTGVTHDFEAGEDTVKNWDGHRGGGYISSRQNVCVFDNLCVGQDGEMTMHLPPHPPESPAESLAYNEEKNHVGYIRLSAFESWEGLYSVHYNSSGARGDYPGWRPAVQRSSIPASHRFADDAEVHVLQRHTYFYQNYGHLLLDDLLSSFAETAHELCRLFFWNSDAVAKGLFLGGVKPSTVYKEGTCFKKVMMGHSSALSLVYPNPLLSVVARKFRAALVMSVVGTGVRYHKSQWLKGPQAALVNISEEQDGAWNFFKWNKNLDDKSCPTFGDHACKQEARFCHRILIYNKTSGYSTSATKRALADACEAVPPLLQRSKSCTRVICSDPSSMPLRTQLLLMSSATVIVSPHGGIASNVLFSNDGAAALLLVGPGDKQRQGAKDTHIYPWLTWLTVRYWLGTGYQDKMIDLVDHIILLTQRVENNILV